MVRLVDEILRSPRFGQNSGLASPAVTVADPASGTGTYLLGVLRRIAATVAADEGEGAVREAINAAINRLIAFEIQLGPFAVAQLRILAEIGPLVLVGRPSRLLRPFPGRITWLVPISNPRSAPHRAGRTTISYSTRSPRRLRPPQPLRV